MTTTSTITITMDDCINNCILAQLAQYPCSKIELGDIGRFIYVKFNKEDN